MEAVIARAPARPVPRGVLLPRLRRLLLLLAAALPALPLLVILASLTQPRWELWHHLATTVLPDYLLTTGALMAGVGAGVLLLGVPPAWLVATCRFPGRALFQWALLLPMAVPAYILAYTYAGLLDVAGPVQTALRESFGWQVGQYWFPEVRSLGGAVTVLSLALMPYVYLLARTAFLEQSACAVEVARTLGCSRLGSLLRVSLPLARPALAAGLVLAMMEALADFGTVQHFGLSTFTTGIFRTWFGIGDATAAAQLSGVALLLVLGLLGLERASRRQARYHATSTRQRPLEPTPLRGGPALAAVLVCLLPLTFGFLLPAGLLFGWVLQSGAAGLDMTFLTLLGNSLELAALAALLTVALALLLAYALRAGASLALRALTRVASLGYAIPGVVVAVGVVLPLGAADRWLNVWSSEHLGWAPGLLFSGTVVALLLAYLVRFLAVSMNAVESGFTRIGPHVDEVARSLGAGFLDCLRRVHWPLLRGTLLTAGLLVFVDVLKELPATLLLRPFDLNTLAVRTYELANDERLADAALPALAIVAAGLLPVVLLSRAIGRSGLPHGARALP